jgi:hypothetical protein
MAVWKWFSCDMKSGQLLAELPLLPSGSITSLICQDGAGSFSLPLTDPATPDDWWISLQPYRTIIAASVDDVIVWAGWVKSTRAEAGDSATVEFVCSTMEAYFQERYIDTSISFVGADQHTIMSALIAQANIDGLNFAIDAPLSGVYIESIRYDRYSDQQIFEMMSELSDLDGGPEWTVRSEWDDSASLRKIKHTVIIRTPYLGSTSTNPAAHQFTFPGNVKSWDITEGGPYSNVVVAGGAGDGATRLMSTNGVAVDSQAINQFGYARFDARIATQLGNVNSVNKAAIGELMAKQRLTTVLTVSIDADSLDVTNLWSKGDTVRIDIDAPNLAKKYSDTWRIIGWDVDSVENTISPHLVEFRG